MDKRRWQILTAGCFINLCIGTLYSWSVFAGPMAERINAVRGTSLTVGDLAIVPTVYCAMVLIFMIVSGYLTDRFGPRVVVFVSGLIYGVGFLISSFADSLFTLCIGFGVFCGAAGTMAYAATLSNTVKFFPDKRGLAGGLITATNSLSSVILPPVANAIITKLDVGAAFRDLGIAYLLVVCLFSLLLMKCPEGYMPKSPNIRVGKNPLVIKDNDKDFRQMLRDKVFYLMALIFFCGGSFGQLVISQASNIAQTSAGMAVAAATVMVSVLALSNAAGRLICGAISDRIGRTQTLSVMLVVAITGQILLFMTGIGHYVTLGAGFCLIGLAYGAFLSIFPGFTADRFGSKNNSMNYGFIFIGYSVAGMICPLISGGIYNAVGNYRPAFIIAVGIACLGLVLTFVYRWIESGPPAQADGDR